MRAAEEQGIARDGEKRLLPSSTLCAQRPAFL
jgi:hypothetical protein